MAQSKTYRGYLKVAQATKTPLHNGTNGEGYATQYEEFVLRAQGSDVYIGDETLDETDLNGILIQDGQQMNFQANTSRGSQKSYDLTEMYYIGGPLVLVLERDT